MSKKTNYKKQAHKYFNNGFNCAQAVIKALDEVSGLEEGEALTAGFGGGLGGHQEICGAASGACMALSYAVFKLYNDPTECKNEAKLAVQEFMFRFKDTFEYVRCAEMTGYDFLDEAEREAFVESGVKTKVCIPAVEFAAELAAEMIEEARSMRGTNEQAR